MNGSRCGQAKPRPRNCKCDTQAEVTQKGEENLTKKNMSTDAVPYGKPATGPLPHGKSKNATAQHDAVAATHLPITTPHGVGFRRVAHTKQNLTRDTPKTSSSDH